MDEDLIIVDDDGPVQLLEGQTEARPITAVVQQPPPPPSDTALPGPSSKGSATPILGNLDVRTTRSSIQRTNKIKPKLKLKLSEKAAAQAPVASFLGNYDRELDSDDEDLAFEEQFILRMPHGEDCEKMRKMAASREISNDVWFKFKDSRRAVFHMGNSLYSSKLVDLPCIIESQKTFDNKHMFKVADISQMLVVEDKIQSEDLAHNDKTFNIDDFIWPHGISPPLHHVRKRRFRKRLNRRTIETVEEEVERLLSEDSLATNVKYEILENVNPDLSDSEFIDREDLPPDAPTPLRAGSEIGDAPTPAGIQEGGEEDGGEEDEDDDEPEGDIDEELAAELDLALGSQESDAEGDESEEDEDEEDEDEDDDDDENVQAKRLLNEEIRDLEAAVAKKATEIDRSNNPLIKRRFEDALKKLRTDLDLKLAQRDQLAEQVRLTKEGVITSAIPGDADADAEEGEAGQMGLEDGAVDDDDLFGANDAGATSDIEMS